MRGLGACETHQSAPPHYDLRREESSGRSNDFGLDLVDIVAGGGATYVYWHTAGLSVDFLEAAIQNAIRLQRARVYIRNAANEVLASELFGFIAGGADMLAFLINHERH